MRKLCEKKVEIIETQACPDHIHMLVGIPLYLSVVQFVDKSILMILDRHANLKYKYGRRNFWARGYFVYTVERNEKEIKEDDMADQISLKEYTNPFISSRRK